MRTSDTRLEVLVVPGIERAVGHVRRWLRDMVGADHSGLYEFTVCVSELMTNALRYTDSGRGGGVRVELTIAGDELRAEITDDGGSDTVPHLRAADCTVTRGRGLRIVDTYADEWGVRTKGAGFTVWFVLRCRSGA